MRTQRQGLAARQSVDYSLQRRGLLRELYAGRVGTAEVCDASHYLLSAARFHGDPTRERCPVCRREYLIRVHYIYGDELGQSSGQARRRSQLPELASSVREARVYEVEVCPGCGWNYLVEQFVIGEAPPTSQRHAGGPSRPTQDAESTKRTHPDNLRRLAQALPANLP